MRERWAIALLIAVSITAVAQASSYVPQPVYGATVSHAFARVSPFQIVSGTTATGTTATGTTATGTTATGTTASTTSIITTATGTTETGTTATGTTATGTTATGTTATGTTASTTASGTTATGTTETGTTATGTTATGTTATGTTASTTSIITTATGTTATGTTATGTTATGTTATGTTFTGTTFQPEYLLTIQSNAGGSVAPPTGYQNSNAVIPILALPNSGYTFVSWTGSGSGSFSGTSPSATVTMDGPITETATFAPTSTVQITVDSNPSSSSTVQVDGSSINTPQTYTWTPGTTHGLFATFNPPCNYNCQATFLYWTSPSIGTVYSQSITYTVPSSSETVTAAYRITQNAVSITIASVPSGLNSIAVDGSPIMTPQTFSWTVGSTHALTANQYCGISGCPTVLKYWQSSSVGTTYAASFTYTVPTYSETVTAYYQASQSVPILVTEIPSGSGPLVVDGTPIIVPQSFYWAAGSTHTLSAQNGYGPFVSWASPSIGAVNANTISYTVPSSGETVTAYYGVPAPSNLVPITITTSVTGPTVAIDGVVTTTPHTYFWPAGSQHTISTSNVNCQPSGCQIQFNSWTSPSIGATYTGTITYTVPFGGETVTGNFTQLTPVPEFNGIAVVASACLATSSYLLRRRRR